MRLKNDTVKYYHNLAIPGEMEHITMQLGGEDRLKRSYPEVYKMLLRSGERAKNIANGITTAPIIHEDDSGDILGKIDSIGIRTLNFDLFTSTYTSSVMSMVRENKSLVIIGDLHDITHDHSLDGFAVSGENSHNLTGFSDVPSSQLVMDQQYEFLASSTFYRTVIDKDGQSYYEVETQKTDVMKMIGASTLVKELIVNDPMPRNKSASHTTIFYNYRTGDCDYYYNNVSSGLYDVEVNLDFSGEVTLQDKFTPVGVNKNSDFMLHLIFNNGAAQFNSKYWDEIKWEIKGHTLSWRFPVNWHNRLISSEIHAADNTEFYCKMYVTTDSGIYVPIVISSAPIDHKDTSYMRIKPLNIQWGCFAKGTMITMSDGTAIPVETVREGDTVRTRTGTARVTGIVTGEEQKMIVIGTYQGHKLLLSKGHPVLTESGWKAADKLSASDVLLTVSGAERIAELHYCDYNDKVYSFSIDIDDAIIAEGIFAGDFERQNKCESSDSPNNRPEKLEGYQEEMKALVQELDRSLKRR